MKKKFIQSVIPAMVAFLFSGIYVSIDGLFIGQSVGDVGLASINIAWPLASVILAVGTGIGMGGAVNISNQLGAGEKQKANKIVGNTITLLIIASIILTAILLIFSKSILSFLGAEGQVLELAHRYVWILGMGSILQVLGNGIIPILRNQNKAWIAMALILTNFVLDTVLSGVFVIYLGLGVEGAAIATLLGQGIALLASLYMLFKKDNRISATNFILDKKVVHSILKIGASPFALTFIPSLTIILINWQALSYGGTTALAAYAVVGYVLSAGQLLLQGIGDGSQPLISFYYGANDTKAVRQVKHWTYIASIATGTVVMVAMVVLKNIIPKVFGVSAETTVLLRFALPLFAILLPFYAFSRTSTSFLYATKKSRGASLMVYGEVLLALPVCVFILPKLFGLTGVWIALAAVQVILVLGAIALLKNLKTNRDTELMNKS